MSQRVYRDITETIGETPVIELGLERFEAKLFLKLEKCNPGQSMKDRMALAILGAAEARGVLHSGGTIVESSSGNTAIGLAMIAASRGYRFIAVVDHHASKEKIDTIKAYGGEIVTVGAGHRADEVAVKEREQTAERLSREIPGAFFVNQAENPDNPAGYRRLAEEILEVLGDVSVLIGAIGTGGSLCGTARTLKAKGQRTTVVAVEPKGSVIFGGLPGPYFQSGTGNPGNVEVAGNVDRDIIDDAYLVSDPEAFNTARALARARGILVGGSGGGVVYAALAVLARGYTGNVVALIPDGGEKYLGTVFNDDWMERHNLHDTTIDTRVRSALRGPTRG